MNEKMKLLIERRIWPKCITVDESNVTHFDKYKFAEMLIQEVMHIPTFCIETGEDQLIETCMVERIRCEFEKQFGVKI